MALRRWLRDRTDATSFEVMSALEALVEGYEAGMLWLEPRTVEKLEPLV